MWVSAYPVRSRKSLVLLPELRALHILTGWHSLQSLEGSLGQLGFIMGWPGPVKPAWTPASDYLSRWLEACSMHEYDFSPSTWRWTHSYPRPSWGFCPKIPCESRFEANCFSLHHLLATESSGLFSSRSMSVGSVSLCQRALRWVLETQQGSSHEDHCPSWAMPLPIHHPYKPSPWRLVAGSPEESDALGRCPWHLSWSHVCIWL